MPPPVYDADNAAMPATASETESFRTVIERYVKPLLYGAELQGPVETTREMPDVVAFDTIHKLAVAVPGSKAMRCLLTRFVPFSEEEKALALHIVTAIHEQSVHTSGACHLLACNAVEQALAAHICPEHTDTVYSVLQIYNQWAAETHEGRRISHTIGICPGRQSKGGSRITALKDASFIKTLAADDNCMLTVGGDGGLLAVENIPSKANALRNNHTILAPAHMTGIAQWAGSGGKVAIRLTSAGEILLFKNKTLVFAKRRSLWRYLPHKRLLGELLRDKGNKEVEEVRTATYLTMLDLAFSRSGGCLGVLAKRCSPRALADLVSPGMLFASETASPNAKVLKKLINGRKFYELPRMLRKQLCAIDGAVLLDANGVVLTAGAIVKTGGNPDGGGGRSAAARALSRNGVGFKVSHDGFVEIYLEGVPLPSFS